MYFKNYSAERTKICVPLFQAFRNPFMLKYLQVRIHDTFHKLFHNFYEIMIKSVVDKLIFEITEKSIQREKIKYFERYKW